MIKSNYKGDSSSSGLLVSTLVKKPTDLSSRLGCDLILDAWNDSGLPVDHTEWNVCYRWRYVLYCCCNSRKVLRKVDGRPAASPGAERPHGATEWWSLTCDRGWHEDRCIISLFKWLTNTHDILTVFPCLPPVLLLLSFMRRLAEKADDSKKDTAV